MSSIRTDFMPCVANICIAWSIMRSFWGGVMSSVVLFEGKYSNKTHETKKVFCFLEFLPPIMP